MICLVCSNIQPHDGMVSIAKRLILEHSRIEHDAIASVNYVRNNDDWFAQKLILISEILWNNNNRHNSYH